MLRSDQLPDFVFVADDGAETRIALSLAAARIRSIGDHLAAKVAAGRVIGLMLPTGPALVVTWLACLHAGLRPLVMQYPTRKQSRTYWSDSVRNTIAVTALAAVVADDYSCSLGLAELIDTIPESEL